MKATFSPNDRVGPYELLVKLGSGGMASVMIAHRRGAAGFERLVVVKRVHRRHVANRAFYDMFLDEARLASSIRHPNVASVIDVIETDGELCLVMDYFECLSVASLVDALHAAGERLPPPVASRIVCDALAGLHAAHEAVDIRRNRLGIVHRDVSPHNLIVDVEGVTRVIDFGIAKAESRVTHTKSGFVKGKLGYMSPEQIEAMPLDRRSDLFSAGIVLHELLTGMRLFRGGSDEFETMRRVLRGDIPDVSVGAPGVPVALDAVLKKALARARDDRYSTALELQAELARIVPCATTQEVGALVSRLGGESIQMIRAELTRMLGFDAAKATQATPASPPSPPSSLASTKGMTVRMRPVTPKLVLVDTDHDGTPLEDSRDAAEESDGSISAFGLPTRRSRAWWVGILLALFIGGAFLMVQAFSTPYFRR